MKTGTVKASSPDVRVEMATDGMQLEVTMGTGSYQDRVLVNTNLPDGGSLRRLWCGALAPGRRTVLGDSAFWHTGRRWLRAQDEAPSATMKAMLGQFANAASAGAKAASEAGTRHGARGLRSHEFLK